MVAKEKERRAKGEREVKERGGIIMGSRQASQQVKVGIIGESTITMTHGDMMITKTIATTTLTTMVTLVM